MRLSIIAYSVDSLFLVTDNKTTNCSNEYKSAHIISISTNLKLKPVNNNLVKMRFTQFQVKLLRKKQNLKKDFPFKSINKSCSVSTNLNYNCVFWDYTLNKNYGGKVSINQVNYVSLLYFIGWSTYGCILTILNSSIYECSCNHTTNFAVLFVTNQLVHIHLVIIKI
jgi:hypothetical protein